MLKKVLISIVIIAMIFSLKIYATETDLTQGEAGENQNQTENVPSDNENKENTSNTNTENTGNEQANEQGSEQGNEQENQTGNEQTNDKPENNNNDHVVQRPNTTTTVTESKSKENDLKQLTINIEGMTPEFNKDITEYYVVTDLKTEQINVTAIPVDEKATVTISGNTALKEGENTITIGVKAEDGTTKMYYIYVNKVDDIVLANAQLEDLQITDYNIFPNFKPTIYNYNIDIKNNTQKLEITAKPERENATVTIEGNENLKEGENIIKVIVTAEDGKTVRTYKIKAYVVSEKGNLKEENKMPAILLLTAVGSCIVILAIFEYNKYRKSH